jgi:hypothetical protein
MAGSDAIWSVALLALLGVVVVVAGLSNAIVGFLSSVGVPAGIAGQLGSIVFFGTLLVLTVATGKRLLR